MVTRKIKRLQEASLAVKVIALALPFAIAGALISTVLTLPNNNLAETVVLGDYTTSPPPSGSPPPGYSSSPTYSPPPTAQTYSPPPSSPPPSSSPPPASQPAPSTPPPASSQPSSTPPPSSTNPSPTGSYTAPPPQSQPSNTPPPTYNPNPSSSTPPPTPTSGDSHPPSNSPPPPSSYPTNPGTYSPPPAAGTYPASPNNVPPTYNGSSAGPNNSSPSPTSNQAPTPAAPPVLTVNDPANCIGRVFGTDAANSFRSGTFNPTNDQIARANSAGCFSAQVSSGPPPANFQGGPNPAPGAVPPAGFNGQPNVQGAPGQPAQPFLSSIAVAPPPQFQADSPAVACAKQILGDGFSQGASPTPSQMAQLQAKCFASAAASPNFVAPGGQIGLAVAPTGAPGAPNSPNGPVGPPPALPPEVKACVLKAGISDADITAIQNGKSPTAQQQQQGEACFSKFAQDKGYTLPTLTPPDPTQPFDPHSKQNECADLVAQTHGMRFNQINPVIVASWGTDDIGKLRSCYGVAAAASASSNGMVFAPTSPQIAVSSTKLDCIKRAIGADKLAAVMGGTATVSESDREMVYSKCIDPTKTAAATNPVLLGVLAAMPASDLESQFIPVSASKLPAPTTKDNTANANNAEVVISGEIDLPAGSTLPSKVDVFVKSTPKVFTVALSKINATKASWQVKIAHNKLELGNHKAYAVATLDDATQVRSPETTFAIASVNLAKGQSSAFIIGVAVASLAALVGAGLAWKWHNKHLKSQKPVNL